MEFAASLLWLEDFEPLAALVGCDDRSPAAERLRAAILRAVEAGNPSPIFNRVSHGALALEMHELACRQAGPSFLHSGAAKIAASLEYFAAGVSNKADRAAVAAARTAIEPLATAGMSARRWSAAARRAHGLLCDVQALPALVLIVPTGTVTPLASRRGPARVVPRNDHEPPRAA